MRLCFRFSNFNNKYVFTIYLNSFNFASSQIDKLIGALPTNQDLPEYGDDKDIISKASLPATFDWRKTKKGNYVTSVKFQKIGSCWAFASTAALESKVLISLNLPDFDLNLAEQTLLSCSHLPITSNGGGYPNRAAQYIKETGLPIEWCDIYRAKIDACYNHCVNWTEHTYKVDWSYGFKAGGAKAIKEAVYEWGPVVAKFSVYDDFYDYTGEKDTSDEDKENDNITDAYANKKPKCAENSEGRCPTHAVLVVGWNEKGFIFKNSWNTRWGLHGYGLMAYSQLTNKVEFGQETYVYGNVAPVLTSLNISKIGKGQVTSTPPGIDCGDTCSYDKFDLGTNVQLTESPSPGYKFDRWYYCNPRQEAICSTQIGAYDTIRAKFLPIKFNLNIEKTGTGSGKISSKPAGINCGKTCKYAFKPGVLTLTAIPAKNSKFISWSGCDNPTSNKCKMTLDADKTVTARFDIK